MVVYVDGERPFFDFIPNPKCNQDFNETTLVILSILEKALEILLNVLIVMSMLLLGLLKVSR